MPNSTPPPVRAWFSRVPDTILILALTALLGFCWSTERRLTAIEAKMDAIGARLGISADQQMAAR